MTRVSLPNVTARASRTELKPEPVAPQPSRSMRNWRVLHACEYARDVLPVIEGQITAGMRPYIVTPQGAGAAELYLERKNLEQPRPLSLLRAWHDVRNWRKSLLECDPEISADVVHTHSFTSGMAAVRNFSCVVYDPPACIEELAISTGQCERGSWMGRSFRVAEQFVLSRTEAIIVHSSGMKAAAEERGAPAESVFVIPEPFDLDPNPLAGGNSFLRERFGIAGSTVVYFVPEQPGAERDAVSDAVLSVLEAFALIYDQLPASALLIEAPVTVREALRGHAERLGVSQQVFVLGIEDAEAVMQNSDVVIVTGEQPVDPVLAYRSNKLCVEVMAAGKTLLAADLPRNRDCSPEGRGCLWFKDGDRRDLTYRIGVLGRDSGFRTALANAGRSHIHETRNSATIGRMYDDAYRHALSRRKKAGTGQNSAPSLKPLTSAGW